MLKNVDAPIYDLEGEPMQERIGNGTREARVRNFVVNALGMGNGEQLTGEEKIMRYRLGIRLADGGEQELSPEDLSTLKRAVATVYPPLIVGRIYDWADE